LMKKRRGLKLRGVFFRLDFKLLDIDLELIFAS
jgi:hypothetical protein